MSLTHYWKLAETRVSDRNRRFQAFICHPDFRRYCQRHKINPGDLDTQRAFLATTRGWGLAKKKGLGLDRPVVQVIPHEKHKFLPPILPPGIVPIAPPIGKLDLSPNLRNGHILALRLDLAAFATHLLAGLSFQIKLYLPHVSNRGGRVSPLLSGPAVLTSAKEGRRYLVVEIDMRHSLDKIRLQVRRLLPPRPVRLPLIKRRKTYPGINLWKVWETYDQTKSFKVGSWKLGIPEATFRKAYYRALALVTGKRYHPEIHPPIALRKKLCPDCPAYPCETPCPQALGYADQDQRSQRDMLSKNSDLETISAKKQSRDWLNAMWTD